MPIWIMVLNALRHQRFVHRIQYDCSGEPTQCSTPYGIRGSSTNKPSFGKFLYRSVLNALRHQRFVHLGQLHIEQTRKSVLNALRHQRFVHIKNCGKNIIIISAQRLTASEVRPLVRLVQIVLFDQSAQRLTASEVRPPLYPCVPNGFRVLCSTPYGIRGSSTVVLSVYLVPSSWCSTPYGIRGSSTWVLVAPWVASRSCSTPYGIRGSSTGRFWHPCSDDHVLNALRHQRFVHRLKGNSGYLLQIVLNALRHQRFVHECSTPYGIRGSYDPSAHFRTPLEVLNALRHQNQVLDSAKLGSMSAQRLTASEVRPQHFDCP